MKQNQIALALLAAVIGVGTLVFVIVSDNQMTKVAMAPIGIQTAYNSVDTDSYTARVVASTPSKFNLTVVVGANGSVSSGGGTLNKCTANCVISGLTSTDNKVTLTAYPAPGYTTSWSGCTTTSSNVCNVTLSGATTVNASFTTATVAGKFTVGKQVTSTATVNVRQTGAGTILGTQKSGAIATVLAGPSNALLNGTNVVWWNLDFTSSPTTPDGWVGEDNLVAYTPSVTLPAITISASPTSIVSGQSSTLTWSSTNATACTGTGGTFAGTKATSGSATVSPTVTTSYGISCTGAGGTSPTANVTVTVTSGGGTSAFLTVSGNNLVYNGQTVILRGENFNNAMGLAGSMSSINANAADYAQARNVLGENSIRFGLSYFWWSSNSTDFYTRMDQNIAWAKTNHLWIIPVMFMWPGNPDGDYFNHGGQASFWTTSSYEQQLTSFWSDFARHYANEPTIAGYDIINEPGPPNQSVYSSWAQTTYNAITAVDSNHFVVLENDAGEGQGDFPNVSGSKILWSSHCYWGCTSYGSNGSGSYYSSPQRWPYWVSEFGAEGSNGTSAGNTPSDFTFFNSHNISWSHFVMHSSSGWYGLYQSWTAGDFSVPWTNMINAVKCATGVNSGCGVSSTVFPQ